MIPLLPDTLNLNAKGDTLQFGGLVYVDAIAARFSGLAVIVHTYKSSPEAAEAPFNPENEVKRVSPVAPVQPRGGSRAIRCKTGKELKEDEVRTGSKSVEMPRCTTSRRATIALSAASSWEIKGTANNLSQTRIKNELPVPVTRSFLFFRSIPLPLGVATIQA